MDSLLMGSGHPFVASKGEFRLAESRMVFLDVRTLQIYLTFLVKLQIVAKTRAVM